MKKLLLLAAVLAIGTNLVAANPSVGIADPSGLGISAAGDGLAGTTDEGRADGFYNYANGIRNNNFSGTNVVSDITDNDTAVHRDGAVNVWRKSGGGEEDTAKTEIYLKVLRPIVIESEAEFLYMEAVEGDGLKIGDIGFRVGGEGNAKLEFKTEGELFQLTDMYSKVRGFDASFYSIKQIDNEATVSESVNLTAEGFHELEVDIYIPDVGDAGIKKGTILATVTYE